MSKEEKYKVDVECTNCGYGNSVVRKIDEVFVFLRIPKGILFDDYVKDVICTNCGCKGTLTRRL